MIADYIEVNKLVTKRYYKKNKNFDKIKKNKNCSRVFYNFKKTYLFSKLSGNFK